MYGSQPTNTV